MENPVNEHSDKPLFIRFCKGDDEAVRLIYDNCYQGVRRMVRKSSKNEEDVKDIFQAGLLGLLACCRRPSFTLTTPVCGLPYGICRNIWNGRLEKESRLNITPQDFSTYVDLSKALQIEEEALQKAERFQLIWKHLQRLPEKKRRVLLLHYEEDKSHEEIASIIPFNNANSAKVQKHKYLKDLIERVKGDPDFE